MAATAEQIAALAMSQNEINYATALNILGVEFDQQYQLGAPGLRGSQRIDIVVWSPIRTAVFIGAGGYYHDQAKQAEDQIKQLAAQSAGFAVVLVSLEDSNTVEAALAHARKYFA